MAPASLLCVSAMLYLFRFVYAEVVTAMPVNGGSYTALSNTTSKRVAALAAACSLISYIATAVVSAEAAVNYAQLLLPAIGGQAATLAGTVVVLGVFAALNLLGLAESANVATGMFVVHFAALVTLCAWALVWAARDGWATLRANLATPYPGGADWAGALYFGYAAALLGITGFETAANYVEEMESSVVYVAVLRNMWASVAVLNPLIGLLALAVMPVDEMYGYSSNLLGPMAGIVGGPAFKAFICVDGVLVLAGSVLTAYVGVGGLLRRLALDRILPGALLGVNRCRGTATVSIVGFFAVCSSLLLALNGDVQMLGSVYNIAFLAVMSMFAVACVVLKVKRPRLPRRVVASWACLLAALAAVLAGLVGNVVRQPVVLAWFALYYGAVLAVVGFMFNRVPLLELAARLVRAALPTPAEAAARAALTRALKAAHEAAEAGAGRGAAAPGAGAGAGEGAGGGGGGGWGGCRAMVGGKHAGARSGAGAGASAGGLGGGRARARRARAATTVGAPGDLAALGEADARRPSPPSPSTPRAGGGKGGAGGGGGGDYSELLIDDDDDDDVDGVASPSAEGAGDGVEREGLMQGFASPSAASSVNEPGEEGEDEEGGAGARGGAAGCAASLRARVRARLLRGLSRALHAATDEPVVFFTKTADVAVLHKAARYVRANEATARLVLVHVADDRAAAGAVAGRLRARAAARAPERATPAAYAAELRAELARALAPSAVGAALESAVGALNAAYPKLAVSALVLRGTAFGPGAVRWTCAHLGVGTQNAFMAMPDERFAFPFAALGGVRVITRVR